MRRASGVHEMIRAFEILAGMEKGQADIIRQILGGLSPRPGERFALTALRPLTMVVAAKG
jgi:hypothetical protein